MSELTELISTLKEINESLRALAAMQERPNESRECRAIRILSQRGAGNLSEIAKAVGVHRTSLYRWPTFMQALERVRGAEQWMPREPRAVSRDGGAV